MEEGFNAASSYRWACRVEGLFEREYLNENFIPGHYCFATLVQYDLLSDVI